MSDALIRKALETRLNAMPPGIGVAWENADFEPAANTAYMKSNLLPAEPENPAQGTTFTRYLGIYQVTLMYPLGKGPGDADAKAEAIRAWFPRNLSLTGGGVTVTVDKTPYKMTGFVDEEADRYAVPVRIPYFANVP